MNEGYDEGVSALEQTAANSNAAIQSLEEATYSLGSEMNLAGYEVGANAAKVGETFYLNIWGLFSTEDNEGLSALANAMKDLASGSGASQLSVTGVGIANTQLLNPALAARYGFVLNGSNSNTAWWTAPVGPQ